MLILLLLLSTVGADVSQFYYSTETSKTLDPGQMVPYPLTAKYSPSYVRIDESTFYIKAEGYHLVLFDGVFSSMQLWIVANDQAINRSFVGSGVDGAQIFGMSVVQGGSTVSVASSGGSIVGGSSMTRGSEKEHQQRSKDSRSKLVPSVQVTQSVSVGRLTFLAIGDFAEYWTTGGFFAPVIPFPFDGYNATSSILRLGPSSFQLVEPGAYLVLYQTASTSPYSQYCVLDAGCSGRNASTQLLGATILTTTGGMALELYSPNQDAPFIPYEVGGSHPVAANLVVVRLTSNYGFFYTPMPPWNVMELAPNDSVPLVAGFGSGMHLMGYNVMVQAGTYLAFYSADPTPSGLPYLDGSPRERRYNPRTPLPEAGPSLGLQPSPDSWSSKQRSTLPSPSSPNLSLFLAADGVPMNSTILSADILGSELLGVGVVEVSSTLGLGSGGFLDIYPKQGGPMPTGPMLLIVGV